VILLVLVAIVGLFSGWAASRVIAHETGRSIPIAIPAFTTAALCIAAAWRFGLAWDLPVYVYFAMVSVPLTIIDLRTHRLPNPLTLSAYPVVLVGLVIPAVAWDAWSGLGRSIAGGVALLAFFLLLHIINPSGMGLGDVKLSAPMGALLAWLSWPTLLAGAFVGFVLAALVGVTLLAMRRAGPKSAMPFGPFMLAGAWVAILASSADGIAPGLIPS
jgi:leader peptidase (prepilin peptidase)/N-methyltransferase